MTSPTIGVILIEVKDTKEMVKIQKAVSKSRIVGHMNVLTFRVPDDYLRLILPVLRQAARENGAKD